MQRKKKVSSRALAAILLKLTTAVLVGGTFLVISWLLIALPRPEISEKERRELAAKPAFTLGGFLSGSYEKDLVSYYEDAVPDRDKLTTAASYLRDMHGFRIDGVEFYHVDGGKDPSPTEDTTMTEQTADPTVDTDPVGEETTAADPVDTEPEETTAAPIIDERGEDGKIDEDILTNNAGIVIVNNRAIMLYGGGYGAIELYAESMNEYQRALGEGVQVYSMNIPTAVEYYLPEQYASMSGSESEQAAYMRSCYKDGVKDVNVFEVLRNHKNEYLYLRTDHHWAPLGAYYAAGEFARVAGVPFADISEYERVDRDGYVGSMYGYTQSNTLLENPDVFIYFKPKNQYTTEYYSPAMVPQGESTLFMKWLEESENPNGLYCVFLGTDDRIAHITTDQKNGRVLMMIKDSYGNAMVPFFTNSFEEIWVADVRYFDVNLLNFVREHGVTDVLVSTCSFSCCGGLSSYFGRLLSQ